MLLLEPLRHAFGKIGRKRGCSVLDPIDKRSRFPAINKRRVSAREARQAALTRQAHALRRRFSAALGTSSSVVFPHFSFTLFAEPMDGIIEYFRAAAVARKAVLFEKIAYSFFYLL